MTSSHRSMSFLEKANQMYYEILLQKYNCKNTFKKNRDNIALFYVKDTTGNKTNETCKIELSMSRSAMLELGKELIRDGFEEGSGVLHFYPTRPGSGITETLGVFLHPNSVEPIIIDDIEPSIDELIK